MIFGVAQPCSRVQHIILLNQGRWSVHSDMVENHVQLNALVHELDKTRPSLKQMGQLVTKEEIVEINKKLNRIKV